MSKYTDIKRTSDQILSDEIQKKKKEHTTAQRKYRVALRIVDLLIKKELNEIGSTFFGSRIGFLLLLPVPKKNYKVVDFRFRSEEVGHIWQLQIYRGNSYLEIIDIRLEHNMDINFSLHLSYKEAVFVEEKIEKGQWEKIIEALGNTLEATNQKLSST